jgi:hypothetical protein
MSMRTYPLEIQEITDLGSEELIGVYSKGHHAGGSELARDPFLTAARAHLISQQCWDEDELDELLEAVGPAFETWRCVPARSWGDWTVMFAKAKPGSRGSFPVTVLRVDG